MIDYWYTEYSYKDMVISYVPAVVHVLSTGRYLTLTPMEEPLKEERISVKEEEKGRPSAPLAVLYFDFDRWNVKKKEREKLLSLSKDRAYHLIGHACSIGKESYNLRLSEKRAKEVEKVMSQMGLRVEKIEARGEKDCKQEKNLWQCRKVEVFQW